MSLCFCCCYYSHCRSLKNSCYRCPAEQHVATRPHIAATAAAASNAHRFVLVCCFAGTGRQSGLPSRPTAGRSACLPACLPARLGACVSIGLAINRVWWLVLVPSWWQVVVMFLLLLLLHWGLQAA